MIHFAVKCWEQSMRAHPNIKLALILLDELPHTAFITRMHSSIFNNKSVGGLTNSYHLFHDPLAFDVQLNVTTTMLTDICIAIKNTCNLEYEIESDHVHFELDIRKQNAKNTLYRPN